MLSREKDLFFIEMEKKQKFQDDNLVETLIHLGFPQLAMKILEEDYRVKVREHEGQVLIESDVSKYPAEYFVNYYEGFNDLGFFMIRKDITFSNETSTFQLQIEDFLILARELVKEAET